MVSKQTPFRPAQRRIHEDIAQQLRDPILDGQLAAGAKLPPERELPRQLFASAPMREAMDRRRPEEALEAVRRLITALSLDAESGGRPSRAAS